MDKKNIKVLALFTAIISLCGNASAQLGYLLFKILDPLIEEYWKTLSRWWIIESGEKASGFLEAIFGGFQSLLTEKVPMSAITPEMWFFIKIIVPFYVLAIVILAVYISMTPGSVRGRAKAKSMLLKLIIGAVLISISPWILEVLFIISENLAKALWGMGAAGGVNIVKGASSGVEGAEIDRLDLVRPRERLGLYGVFADLSALHRTGGIEIFALQFTLLLGLISLILIRQVMVIIFGILLPVAFFLYFFYPTKHIGKDMFIQTFLWTFTPVAWTLALVVIGIVHGALPVYIPELYMLIGAFLFFIGSPMLIMGVGEWLAFLVLLFEVIQAAPLSMGIVIVDETMK